MKSTYLVLVGVAILASAGCASLNSNVPFQYQPSLVSLDTPIPKSVGFTLLTDARPERDKKYTKSIKDVSEKITAKLIEDFEKSRIFREVHYPARPNDDLMITGTVNRFNWRLTSNPILYVPYIGVVMFFGVPVVTAYGITDIHLEVKNSATGEIVGRFHASSELKNPYTIYNFKAGERGAELAESFRDVAKKLKQDIVLQLTTQ